MSVQYDVWVFRVPGGAVLPQIEGFGVEAVDGSIGHVHDVVREGSTQFIVVDTGPWIFGKKVVLPAGTIDRVDQEAEKLYLDRTKDQIKSAPDIHEQHDEHGGDGTAYRDVSYQGRIRDEVGDYYGPGGGGHVGYIG